MGAASCLSKCVIILINLLFWVGAALMIFSGVSLLTHADGVADDVNKTPGCVAVVIGCLLFVCGFVGICGACCEKKVLLGIFEFVAVVTLIMHIFVFSFMFAKRNGFMTSADNFMDTQFNNYGNDGQKHAKLCMFCEPQQAFGSGRGTQVSPTTTVTSTTTDTVTARTSVVSSAAAFTTAGTATNTTAAETTSVVSTAVANTTKTSSVTSTSATVTTALTTAASSTVTTALTTAAPSPEVNATKFIDDIQSSLHCCGWTNYSDWDSFDTWKKENTGYVPHSCCNDTAAGGKCGSYARLSTKNATLIYQKGCEREVHNVLTVAYDFVAYSAVAFSVLLLIGVVGGMYLIHQRRKDAGFSYSSIVA